MHEDRLGVVRENVASRYSLLAGAPDDRACDVVVYLPAAILDPLALGQLLESAEELGALHDAIEEEQAALGRPADSPPPTERPTERPTANPQVVCERLMTAVLQGDDSNATWNAAEKLTEQCMSCDELLETSDNSGDYILATSAYLAWEERCQ